MEDFCMLAIATYMQNADKWDFMQVANFIENFSC